VLGASRDAARVVDVLVALFGGDGFLRAVVLGSGSCDAGASVLQYAMRRAQVVGHHHVVQRRKHLTAQQRQRGDDEKHVASGLLDPRMRALEEGGTSHEGSHDVATVCATIARPATVRKPRPPWKRSLMMAASFFASRP
jgi:hypothetical protein